MYRSPYSTTSLAARLFPPPEYLAMPAAGVDISDHSIKYVSLRSHKGVPTLVSYGKLELPLDVIERGEITDPVSVTKLLTRLKAEHNITHAHVSLPEEHAYLFQMELPVAPPAETEQMLEFHLKENVPIGADEAVFDHNIIREQKGKRELNVSVYPLPIALQYSRVFEDAGIQPLSLEIEGQATARALLDPRGEKPTLVVDIGRNDASLSISMWGDVTFTAGLESGGDDLTRAIARSLDVSFQEAEKLKRKYGFSDTKEARLVYEALLPIVQDMADTIRKHLMYWQIHMRNTSSGKDQEVERVVLAGGNANLHGLVEYLEASLQVPVEVGNVWHNLFSFDEQVPAIHAQEALEYATSVGLALRSLSRNM